MSLHFLPAPVSGTCGGFLCDEMGLGKTLESLMLILSNPAPPGWAVSFNDVWSHFDNKAREDEEDEEESDAPIPIRATLIIVPSNLLNQWQEEVETHVEDPAKNLKWYVH